MARIPRSGTAVTAGSANIFFTQGRYERALEGVRVRLQRRAVADYSCLPDLVEVGGFLYESGDRRFEPWSASLIALLGDSVRPLLKEAWGFIPRASAEKFAALVNGVLSERDRIRIEQAFTRLKFPVAKANPDLSTSTGATADNPDASVHQHTCSKCGTTFSHDAWECEPPSDSLCNLCAEEAMGPMPIWIQRWASERGEDPAEAPAATVQAEVPHICTPLADVGRAAQPAPEAKSQ